MTDKKDNPDLPDDVELQQEQEDQTETLNEENPFSHLENEDLFEHDTDDEVSEITPLTLPDQNDQAEQTEENNDSQTTNFSLSEEHKNDKNRPVSNVQEPLNHDQIADSDDIDDDIDEDIDIDIDDEPSQLFDDFGESTDSQVHANILPEQNIDVETQVNNDYDISESEIDIDEQLESHTPESHELPEATEEVLVEASFDDKTKEISRDLIQPTGDIPPSFKSEDSELDSSEEQDHVTTPHNPMFTPMDSLTEVPQTEDFDENTGGYDASTDSSIYVDEKQSAKERFLQIKSNIFKFKSVFLNKVESLKNLRSGGGGNGGDGGDGGNGDDDFFKDDNSKKNFKAIIINFFKKFDWDKIFKNIFSPESRQFHHNAFLITLFVFTSYYSGKFIGDMLNFAPKKAKVLSAPPQNNGNNINSNALASISKNNLFNTEEHVAPSKVADTSKKEVKNEKKEEEKNIICKKAQKKTSLPLKLKNTVVLQDSVKSIASVQLRNESSFEDFREGDMVENMARIEKIDRLKVVLKNLGSGDCEFISNIDESSDQSPLSKSAGNILSPKEGKKLLEQKEGDIVNQGNTYKIKKETRDKMLENLDQLLTQARAIQIKNPDGTLSFKMTEIVPGSFYSQLDIQDGDIINSLNGKPIKSLNEVMGLFGQIKNISHFQIGIKRSGQKINKEYNIE